ncbi:MAG: GNAT family N-acetyltransferase [Clostridium sp.]|uniref:GNAT family N-acetyltransferase n=1 Tax=Clostridium sp. TaxID=1506 RepID=UPI0025BC34CE|nr:GNAT family N-acetyltransferase [Clostridium sp.]MCF0147209.1 GNAT family N-acetyltransferase [Clostridium sp.]
MIYRRAIKSEISELVELRKKQLIDEGLEPKDNIDFELEEFFESTMEKGLLIQYVAIEDNIIIATGGVCFYNLPPSYSNISGKTAYITNMYTKDEYRGRGIATKLLNLLVDEVKRNGCKVIKLQASIHGKPVYKKFGFKEAEGHMIMRI